MASGTPYASVPKAGRKTDDYYELENILFSQTLIPVTVATDVHGLGFLDPSGNDEDDLKAGAKLKLPLWLAEPLTKRKVTVATMPKTHDRAIRYELRADASHVSMAQNPYIYELGSILAQLTGDVELPAILSATFTARFSQLWDNARNWRDEDTSTATASMCNSEKKLFNRGYDSISDYQKWSHRKQEGISAAPVIQIISKNRKRVRPTS